MSSKFNLNFAHHGYRCETFLSAPNLPTVLIQSYFRVNEFKPRARDRLFLKLIRFRPRDQGKGRYPLLWAGSRAVRDKMLLNEIANRPNYCVTFIVYSHITNTTAGRIIQPSGPWVGDLRLEELSWDVTTHSFGKHVTMFPRNLLSPSFIFCTDYGRCTFLNIVIYLPTKLHGVISQKHTFQKYRIFSSATV